MAKKPGEGNMIKKLKRAAKFLGHRLEYILVEDNEINVLNVNNHWVLLNPHEETGRHWLVEMEGKLTPNQWYKFAEIMYKECLNDENSLVRWFRTAPSELCFEKIMEVIP